MQVSDLFSCFLAKEEAISLQPGTKNGIDYITMVMKLLYTQEIQWDIKMIWLQAHKCNKLSKKVCSY